MAPRNANENKRTRQPSLLKKPIIEVRGKLGKPSKSKKRKVKKTSLSTVDFYEDWVEGREKITREDKKESNAVPRSLDQEIPRSLQNFIKSKEKLATLSKLSKSKRKAFKIEEYRKTAEAFDDSFTRPVAAVPAFKQGIKETDKSFLRRVQVETNEFMKIAKFEDENECKVAQNEKGEYEIVKKVRRKQMKNKQFREKRKEKKKKLENEKQSFKDFTDFHDKVKFNERVDRPPLILSKPRKANSETSMGKRLASMKFMKLIGDKETVQKDPLVSLARKEVLQEERQRAIDLYRNLKAQKLSRTSTKH